MAVRGRVGDVRRGGRDHGRQLEADPPAPIHPVLDNGGRTRDLRPDRRVHVAQYVRDNFNSFAQSHTNQSDTYHSTISTAQSAGVNTDPGFSFSNTIPLLGILAISTIYPFISAAYSGELRQARSIRTANMMGLAGVATLGLIGIFGAIFLHTFGNGFVIAANSSSGLPPEIAASPTYFLLLSASVGYTLIAVFLVVTYCVYWPLNTYCNFMQQTRIFFAWAFDGLFPFSVTKVSRHHTPYVALILTLIVSVVTMYWATSSASYFGVIVYATLLAMITMMLVGLCAAIVPYRRPDFYRAGATQRRFLGIPVVSIAGVGAILAGGFVWVMYLHYAEFGVAHKDKMVEFVVGTILGGVILYGAAAWIRSRQGVNIALAYAEVPPE